MFTKTAAAASLVTISAAQVRALKRCTVPDGTVVFRDAPYAGKGEIS